MFSFVQYSRGLHSILNDSQGTLAAHHQHICCSSERHSYRTDGLRTAPSGCPLAKPTLNPHYPNPAHFPTKPILLVSANDPAILSANQPQTWMPLLLCYVVFTDSILKPVPWLLKWAPIIISSKLISLAELHSQTNWDRIPAIYLLAIWPQENSLVSSGLTFSIYNIEMIMGP